MEAGWFLSEGTTSCSMGEELCVLEDQEVAGREGRRRFSLGLDTWGPQGTKYSHKCPA